MATNQKSLLRQWHMLQMVPAHPDGISTAALHDKLHAHEFPVTKRTVERDLQELSGVFPIFMEEGTRPYRWSRHDVGAGFNLRGLTVPEALTLTLVEQHLRLHLPPDAIEALRPLFGSAARTLGTVGPEAPSRAWLDKVRSIAPQQPLLPPQMDPACQRDVYTALMKDHQLKLHYRKRDALEDTVYDSVHPLAIVQRGGLVYLVCMFNAFEDVRTLALHRVRRAEVRYEPARRKEGFDIDAYIATGQFGVISGAPVNLRAVFTKVAGEHLFETPLSADQVLSTGADGRLHLAATVPNTRALVWWLLGFGDGVVVEEPAGLREEMAGIAKRMVAAYA